jgi:hypothetical protein
MKKSIAIFFALALLVSTVATQTPQKPREEIRRLVLKGFASDLRAA